MPATHDASCTAAVPPFGARPPGRALARRRLDIAQACFVVLAGVVRSGRLAPCVGIDTAILGVARLRQRHGVDAILLVALGTAADADAAAELARLRELVRALAMTAHVCFLVAASLNSVRDCHASADVLVSTPLRMADASSVTGAGRDVAFGQATAVILSPRDAEALAAHLARLQRRRAPVHVTGAASRVATTASRKAPA